MHKRKTLRYYQKDACRAMVADWQDGKTPCISVFTGLGKSLITAALTDWAIRQGDNIRVLIMVPSPKLVQQNYRELVEFIRDSQNVGIVCNFEKKMQLSRQIIVAQYHSFYSKRLKAGRFDYIIWDEAHDIGNRPESMCRKIISSAQRINPNVKIGGMTATPYRMGQGLLINKCQHGEPLFDSIPYDTSIEPGIKKLVEEKYLARLEVINTHGVTIDLDGVKMSGLEYNQSAVGVKFHAIAARAVADLKAGFEVEEIETALIFVSTCANGDEVLRLWGDPETIRMTSSKSTKQQRKIDLDWFENGQGKRYLINVNFYIKGFDYPQLQALGLLFATTSPGKLLQILGRVVRPYGDLVGKIWDYGSNIERLGGIDDIKIPKQRIKKGDAPKKLCTAILDEGITWDGIYCSPGDNCNHANRLSAKKCAKCGAKFITDNDEGMYHMRTRAQALQLNDDAKKETFAVHSVYFESYVGKNSGIPMIKMLFYDDDVNLLHVEYICVEHTGKAKALAIVKIKELLKNQKDFRDIENFEGGINVRNLLFLFENYYDQFFKKVKSITIIKGHPFNKFISWELD